MPKGVLAFLVIKFLLLPFEMELGIKMKYRWVMIYFLGSRRKVGGVIGEAGLTIILFIMNLRIDFDYLEINQDLVIVSAAE